ncbi:magnesium transporter [Paenibacillus selenitireducens]|uniref:Magnesium transporter n=1 Tax=Paenibacillus selenitireducens TaxID=1324314 RepID=A0A1T2XI01_9BACL|nr:MgtC/SapB family protein [Paenibacillus selenitireducens]OPA79435.1 magnesium transporter [Paenibacillus selenitireducens]
MLLQLEFLLRLIIAGICGVMIGYERKSRMKEAGVRTHFVVAIGAALMMMVSKYGFDDILGHEGVGLDPSRVASQVVSGISFLGAGMIFLQRQHVKGLTTAAGIWTTAGIGLAFGSGMYFMGAGVTLIILAGQKLLHRQFRWLAFPKSEQLILQMENEPDLVGGITRILMDKNISILNFHAEKMDKEAAYIEIYMQVKVPGSYPGTELLSLIQEIPGVKSVELQ